MPAFFIQQSDIQDSQVVVRGDLLHHLRASLRCQPGETLRFTVPDSQRYRAQILTMDRHHLTARIEETIPCPAQTGPRVVLAQALLKHDPMDWVVQKSTELGVHQIIPLITARGVVRPDPARTDAQCTRWRKIALEAAQQSEQWRIPTITPPVRLDQWLQHPREDDLVCLLYERAGDRTRLDTIALEPVRQGICLVIGPEGGWREEEVERMTAEGFVCAGMGAAILRSDTAALASLSIVQSRLGRL